MTLRHREGLIWCAIGWFFAEDGLLFWWVDPGGDGQLGMLRTVALKSFLVGSEGRVQCLGTLILQGYTPKQLEYKTGGPSIVSHLYTQELLRNLLAELDIRILPEYDAEILEGTGHQGQSALVGLVAKRY